MKLDIFVLSLTFDTCSTPTIYLNLLQLSRRANIILSDMVRQNFLMLVICSPLNIKKIYEVSKNYVLIGTLY